jgi:hypothetical protein
MIEGMHVVLHGPRIMSGKITSIGFHGCQHRLSAQRWTTETPDHGATTTEPAPATAPNNHDHETQLQY